MLGVLASLVEGASLGVIVTLVYALLGEGAGFWPLPSGLDGRAMLVGLLIALVLLQGAVSGWYALLTSKVSSTVADRTRQALYGNFMNVDYAYVADRGVGSLINAMEWEALFVPEALNQLSAILINACALAVYGVYFVVLSWQLAVIAALFALPVFATMLLTGRMLREPGERRLRSYEAHSKVTIASLGAMRTLRMHDAQADYMHTQRSASGAIAWAEVAIARRQGWIRPLRQAGTLALGAGFVMTTQSLGIATAALLATLAVMLRLLPHLATIEAQTLALFSNAAAVVNVADASVATQRLALSHGSRAYDGRFGEIRFDAVSFVYPGQSQASLDAAQLRIAAGSVTVIVGPSGSGKTTVVNLLARLSDPSSGTILVDGADLRELSRSDWLAHTAFAGQDVELLDGTILSNIALGRSGIGPAEATQALRLAGALEFVDRLPNGLATPVGDRGLRLSGGQRQRIGLARALARQPSLLILDEAANAVDPAMESAILAGLRAARPALTLIVVTHRGEFAGADQVLVAEAGRLSPMPMAVMAL